MKTITLTLDETSVLIVALRDLVDILRSNKLPKHALEIEQVETVLVRIEEQLIDPV